MDIGVPATIEHQTETNASAKQSAKHVAETVQFFITLMDSLKLNFLAVDQLHPQLSDLIQSLHKLPTLPPDFSGKNKVRDWLIKLNRMKASEEISKEDSRQLLFDLERYDLLSVEMKDRRKPKNPRSDELVPIQSSSIHFPAHSLDMKFHSSGKYIV
jgi:hypothetical protein